MSEPWTRAIDDDPHAFRDPGSVRRLLAGLRDADDERRLDALRALMRVVKALAEDPVEASQRLIREDLASIVDLLLETNAEASGCAISILRRIESTETAVNRLLEHLEAPPEGSASLLIEALGAHPHRAFPAPVEELLCRYLLVPEAARAAGYALYCGYAQICLPTTLDALRRASAPDALAWGRYYALLTLCCLLSSDAHGATASRHLEAILGDASESSRREVSAALGWATTAGLPLLRRLSEDPAPSVRLAVAESLVRDEYRGLRETHAILHRLAGDPDPAVREFVDLALADLTMA